MARPPTNNESASQGDRPMTAPAEGLSFLRTVATRNRIVLIFCILALIAVAANVKLILDLSGTTAGHEIPATLSSPEAGQIAPVHAADLSRSIRNRLSVLLGVMIVCLGSMIYLFVSRVVFPLHAIAKVAEEMARGNLSVSAPSHHGDDVGELGHIINNLAVNFQEVLLLTGTAVGNSYEAVERIQLALERGENVDRTDLKEQVTALKKDLEMLGTVVKDFQFYQTRFDGQKVVSQRSRTDG
jgi:hypothetical protein